MHEGSLILKQDMLGRVRVPAQRRREMVADFRRSGLSGAQFARLAGIKYPTLMAWVKRGGGVGRAGAGPHGSSKRKRSPLLVEAVVTGPESVAAAAVPLLLVDLGGGAQMELREPGQVALAAQLIKALQAQPQPQPQQSC